MIKTLPFALAFVTLASFAGIGCSAADPITNHFDCHDICQRYADCIDHDYNVDDCKDRCENAASNSDDKQNKLDDCHDCIGDGDSCIKDIAQCSGSCSAFVP